MITLAFIQNMSMMEWILVAIGLAFPLGLLYVVYRVGKNAGRLEELSRQRDREDSRNIKN